MIVKDYVDIKINGRKVKYYRELGYDIPIYIDKDKIERVRHNTVISVKISDIPNGSHEMIPIVCDYCNNEFYARKEAYIRQHANDVTNTDCCSECRSKKTAKSNLIRFGVENQFQRESIKEKSKISLMKSYGVDHPMKSVEILSKVSNSLYRNGSAPSSSQQRYIHSVIGGELNYSDATTGKFNLDIAFPDEKIYFEYDGSGHKLQVKFGNLTDEEFDKLELKRSYFLNRRGWLEIRLISLKDCIPLGKELLCLMGIARKEFANGRTHIIFDVDKNIMKTSQYEKELNLKE